MAVEGDRLSGEHWSGLLREVLADRPVVVAMDVLVGAAHTAGQLRDLGVTDLLLVASMRGVGPIDAELEAQAVMVGPSTAAGDYTIMQGIRAWQAVLDDLPEWVRDRLDAFDPDRRAWVVSALFHAGATVAGRQVLGARPASWQALEDKTTIDDVWDAAGVARAPSRVVDMHDPAAVAAASRDLDRGAGTCWVADNTTGWHGGGEYLRWTGPGGDPTRAVDELVATGSPRARVMPFLEGRPCSIHGWVFDDAVIALRPCEMVVLRDDEHRFVYGGASTVWEPLPSVRETMRGIARRVGTHLAETVGYRGSFSVDGVLTDEGFLPTELNPRFGGALLRVGAGIDLPIYLLHLASVSRPDLDWRPADLEAAVLSAADVSPVGRVMVHLPDGVVDGTWRLGRTDGRWIDLPADAEEAEVVVEVGGSLAGPMAMVHLPTLERGASAAEAFVALRPVLSQRLGVDLPVLQAGREPSGVV